MAGIVLTLLTAICSFILIPLKGVVGYVLSLILANLFTGVYSFFFSGSYKYCSPGSVNNEYCREMLQYSVPLIPNGVMWWLVNALNRPIMETYVGLHGIGLFAVANKFPGIIAMIFTIFVSSWQSHPTWVCGLKHQWPSIRQYRRWSHPAWEYMDWSIVHSSVKFMEEL